jgi:hypothetical protein
MQTAEESFSQNCPVLGPLPLTTVPNRQGFGSGSVFGIWIRIQEGKNDPQNEEKLKKYHVLKCWMFSFES